MNTRSNFDSSLKQLKDMSLEMARLSEIAVKEAMDALIRQDLEKAKQVIEADNVIDELEFKIDDKATLMIATQSPVAKDLRKILVGLKISSEVERIADQAVNIAKSALHIGKEKHIKEIVDIPKMMDMALEMLNEALKAFYTEDAALARKCAEKDDAVDEMYGRLVQELLGYIPEKPSSTNQITQLSFVCRYIERIADHTTNIAENVIFLVTGKRYDLNT
ncbi:phosphate signaling complex protein PhoU [Neobacillus terrae]|uniref:phosphate signaling complex protein PhoU n=1 Tax=Neobacillus terrae TaxID=3034837 RepID=UPI00140A25FC|nr:phosphate signaling complex protein PhoU [Neobacillus terrae]NHM30317.1 phosphate signaling complex protein PhoU [Neobacillus terrae]